MRTYHSRYADSWNGIDFRIKIIPAEIRYSKVAYATSRIKADSKLKAVLFQDQEQARS